MHSPCMQVMPGAHDEKEYPTMGWRWSKVAGQLALDHICPLASNPGASEGVGSRLSRPYTILQ